MDEELYYEEMMYELNARYDYLREAYGPTAEGNFDEDYPDQEED